jgi:hypothetical protein
MFRVQVVLNRILFQHNQLFSSLEDATEFAEMLKQSGKFSQIVVAKVVLINDEIPQRKIIKSLEKLL